MPPKGKLDRPADRGPGALGEAGRALARDEGAARAAPTAASPSPSKHRQFWSFQPVKAVPPSRPSATRPGRGRAVDRFILAGLEAKGLAPAAPADKRTLLRRATFDLIGLPPTPEEIDAFLADDSPDAFAKVVDRLLASPQYGERWGRHWLDVVRYADARDLIQLPAESDFREAWRYRDWVVDVVQPRPALHGLRPRPGRRRPAAAARVPAASTGRPGRHRPAGHRGLRARRRGQGPDDRRLRQRPDRRRRPGVPRADASPAPAATTTSSTRSPPRTTTPWPASSSARGSSPAPCPATRRWSACRSCRRPRSPDARRRTPPTRGGGRSSNSCSPTRPTAPIATISTSSLTGQTARYLVAACECRKRPAGEADPGRRGEAARASRGRAGRVGRVSRPGREAADGGLPAPLRDAAAGQAGRRRPREVGGRAPGGARRAGRARRGRVADRRRNTPWPAPRCSAFGRTIRARHRRRRPGHALAEPRRLLRRTPRRRLRRTAPSRPPRRSTATPRPVLRFDGQSLLEAPRPVPPAGSAVRRLPDRGNGRAPASASSAGKMPTSASTGWG